MRHRDRGGPVDRQARQFQARGFRIPEFQHHLEQRRIRGRPFRIHGVDDVIERDLGVCERAERTFPRTFEKVSERGRRVHRCAQHDGIDKHSHHVVECGVATPGDRGSHTDVIGSA